MTLTEFLLARIAEDEAMWGQAKEIGMHLRTDKTGPWSLTPPEKWPARMLAECAAKRRIVEEVVEGLRLNVSCGEAHGDNFTAILASLAMPYADHPDYRQEWKP